MSNCRPATSDAGSRNPSDSRRDRWRARIVLAVFVVAAYLEYAYPGADVPTTRAAFGAIFAAVALIGGWLADKAVTIAVALWQVIRIVAEHIWQFAVLVARVFADVFRFLARFWSNVLRPAINSVWNQIGRFVKWLNTTVKPILTFLNRVRREIAKFYDRFFQPILNTIESIRRVLRVLSFLHLDIARELDRKLAALEARILEPITAVMRRVNQVIDVVDRIVTLNGLIQRITLLASLTGYQGDWLNLWWNAQTSELTPDERARLLSGGDAVAVADVGADTRRYLQLGAGAMGTDVQIGADTARGYLELIG